MPGKLISERNPKKIARSYHHYKNNGKFENTSIVINEDGVLIDGFCAFLVSRLFGVSEVGAIVI